jgi:hypothetical protein
MPITEQMIETCFNIFFTEDQNIDPAVQLGMNRTSARMTIVWFRCLFNGELYRRTASTMQVNWILNRLYHTQDFDRLRNTLNSLNQYCDYYHNKPMPAIRRLVEEFEEILPDIE